MAVPFTAHGRAWLFCLGWASPYCSLLYSGRDCRRPPALGGVSVERIERYDHAAGARVVARVGESVARASYAGGLNVLYVPIVSIETLAITLE